MFWQKKLRKHFYFASSRKSHPWSITTSHQVHPMLQVNKANPSTNVVSSLPFQTLKISYFTWPISKFCFFHCNQLIKEQNSVPTESVDFKSGTVARLAGGEKMAEKVQLGSKLPLTKMIPFSLLTCLQLAYFHRPVLHWIWSLRNSTAMKVRAEAGMYHVILGTLPLNNPLTPSIIQILRIASSQPLYLQVHNSISKQYYLQNYICLSIWNTNIACGPS